MVFFTPTNLGLSVKVTRIHLTASLYSLSYLCVFTDRTALEAGHQIGVRHKVHSGRVLNRDSDADSTRCRRERRLKFYWWGWGDALLYTVLLWWKSQQFWQLSEHIWGLKCSNLLLGAAYLQAQHARFLMKISCHLKYFPFPKVLVGFRPFLGS